MKKKKKNKKSNADLWRECEVNNLAGHFHKFDSGSQYERLGQLYLSKYDLDFLFPENKEVYSFDIRLGLDSESTLKDSFTFRPLISVKYSAKSKPVERIFQYGPAPDPKLSYEVPLPFVDWLCKNWMELDISLMDDVFAASFDETDDAPKTTLPKKRINKRLLSYHFTDTVNETFRKFINDHRGRIDQFMFHLGVDMNKFDHKDQFSFSPVFEVHFSSATEKQIKEIRKSGLRCVPKTKTGDEVVYFEYSAPCPPTCPEL